MARTIRAADSRPALLQSRTRAAVLWGLGVFVALQLSFLFPLSHWVPTLCDPEYGHKLKALRGQLARKPKDSPLCVSFGSSLLSMALRPDVLARPQSENSKTPMVFNLGLNGARAVVSLMCLQRLLAEGIRPDWVLIEVYPRFYFGPDKIEHHYSAQRMRHTDFPTVRRYFPDGHRLRKKWRAGQCFPWYFYRNCVQNVLLPTWVPADKNIGEWESWDEWGWANRARVITQLKKIHTPERLEKDTKQALDLWNRENLTIKMDVALREILDTCQRENIGAVLIRMPESSYYRNVYADAFNKRIDRWLGSLRQDFAATLVDALEWIPDGEFADGIHVDAEGAARFTIQLEVELLRHLQARRPQPAAVKT